MWQSRSVGGVWSEIFWKTLAQKCRKKVKTHFLFCIVCLFVCLFVCLSFWEVGVWSCKAKFFIFDLICWSLPVCPKSFTKAKNVLVEPGSILLKVFQKELKSAQKPKPWRNQWNHVKIHEHTWTTGGWHDMHEAFYKLRLTHTHTHTHYATLKHKTRK